MASLNAFDQQFLSTFLRQNFDLPDSMIYYISKNPKSSKVYQKLIQCCKYFFIKNPILVIHCLKIDDDGWKTCSNKSGCKEDGFHHTIHNRILSSCCKLWIDRRIRIISTDSNAASNLIPKTYCCDAAKCFFANQRMSFQQFLFYAENAVACWLENTFISSDGCAEIPFEEIASNIPNISKIVIEYGPDLKNASSDTVKKLLQIPYFNNITHLLVVNASEKFDIAPIYDHYKKNRSRFTFGVCYQNGLSEGFVEKMDVIAKEILDYKFHDFVTPFIGYQGQNMVNQNALMKLHKKTSLLFPS